jgi:uncharacterized membrane protein YhaH (DUF805 family)
MDLATLLFSFRGRLNRQPFWIATLILDLCVVATVFAVNQWIYGDFFSDDFRAGQIVAILVFGWPSLAITVKRFHDRDKSGWWSLILLIPFIGGIWWFVDLGCLRGTAGPNRFGDDPLEGRA